eukprot:scaffold2069_cov187-Amphora_coffeaeformis.AAC.2
MVLIPDLVHNLPALNLSQGPCLNLSEEYILSFGYKSSVTSAGQPYIYDDSLHKVKSPFLIDLLLFGYLMESRDCGRSKMHQRRDTTTQELYDNVDQ